VGMLQQRKSPSWSTWHVSTSAMRRLHNKRDEHRRHADLAIRSQRQERKVQRRLCALMSEAGPEAVVRLDGEHHQMPRSSDMKRSCGAFWSWRKGMRRTVGILMFWVMRTVL